MFKILSKNSKRLWRNSTHKIFTQFGGKKQCFCNQKIPKIRMLSIKRSKSTTTYPHWPIFKIYNENSNRLWRNSANKIWGKKLMLFTQKIPKICETWVKRSKGITTYPHYNLCLKFETKTPRGYGETARTRFGAKNNVFSPKNT